MRKKIYLFSAVLALFLGLVFLTGSAGATTPELCGVSDMAGAGGIFTVKKDVQCEKSTSWTWKILKKVDQASLLLSPGQSQVVNYTITASAAAESSYRVHGRIRVVNRSSNTITINSVTDTLGPVTCDGGPLPIVLAPDGEPNDGVSCYYDASLGTQPEFNSATAIDVDGNSVTATAPIDWSKATVTETDECVAVSDSYAGDLGTVCANGQTSFSFNYSRTIGPFPACTETSVENVASFVTNDSGATGSSSATVTVKVPCDSVCTLTPGYWKTHSMFGPAPYDDTWAMLGENTPFFSSGKTYYQALWTPPQGNAYYILAHAYIAAKLNQLNGSDLSAVQASFDAATALFSNPANTPTAVGALRGAAKATWTSLATTLDNYNNGLTGPGHCSE